MEQLQCNGVVLEMVRFSERQVIETHHMNILKKMKSHLHLQR